MRRGRGEHVTWPPDSTGSTFEARIFNALIDSGFEVFGPRLALGLCGLADAGPNGSGTSLIKALAHVLQYVLPFELKGALARRAMHIPDRFLAEKLKVSTPRKLAPL